MYMFQEHNINGIFVRLPFLTKSGAVALADTLKGCRTVSNYLVQAEVAARPFTVAGGVDGAFAEGEGDEDTLHRLRAAAEAGHLYVDEAGDFYVDDGKGEAGPVAEGEGEGETGPRAVFMDSATKLPATYPQVGSGTWTPFFVVVESSEGCFIFHPFKCHNFAEDLYTQACLRHSGDASQHVGLVTLSVPSLLEGEELVNYVHDNAEGDGVLLRGSIYGVFKNFEQKAEGGVVAEGDAPNLVAKEAENWAAERNFAPVGSENSQNLSAAASDSGDRSNFLNNTLFSLLSCWVPQVIETDLPINGGKFWVDSYPLSLYAKDVTTDVYDSAPAELEAVALLDSLSTQLALLNIRPCVLGANYLSCIQHWQQVQIDLLRP